MSKWVEVSDIFKSLGQPTTTYVERKRGLYERSLSDALKIKGRLCLLTGPSKTGKTTLYTKVIADLKQGPLTIRCDATISTTEFWRRALEKIDFDRINKMQNEKRQAVETSVEGGL